MKSSKIALFFSFITILLAGTTAHAEYWRGTKLIQILEDDMRGAATFDVGLATGYIMGASDSAAGSTVCMPPDVTVKQAKQVVFNFMKSRPDSWNYSADSIVVAALKETWPCKK